MKYESLPELSYEETLVIFNGDDHQQIVLAIYGLAFYNRYPEYAEQWGLFYLSHENESIRGAAATSLGYVARLNGTISKASHDALKLLSSQYPEDGVIEDALEDVEHWLNIHRD